MKYPFDFMVIPWGIAESKAFTISEKMVLASLATRSNGGENLQAIKQRTIAKDWNLGVRTVKLAINSLKKKDLVEVKRRGKRISNLYRFKRENYNTFLREELR